MKDRFLYESFKDINLNDPFFDSLKKDYAKFEGWFKRKAEEDEKAYIQTVNGEIEGFLYLKIEEGPITDVEPNINYDRVVKIGTMKIDAHGTRLGERFIKKTLDFAIKNNINYVYVTVFEKHNGLINLYEKYGFRQYAKKITSDGIELVLLKDIEQKDDNFRACYPKINLNSKLYLLAVKPEYHTRLFPDSILNNESIDIVEDISHTNSIEKIYICRMSEAKKLKHGDLLLIYRTTDIPGRANFRAVATSICVADEVKLKTEFSNFNEYKNYCKNYSVFTESELRYLYNNDYFIIKMTYNVALSKKVTRLRLIEEIGMDSSNYWGFFEITKDQLEATLEAGMVNDKYLTK